jgi:hypothetical protein
MSFHVGQLVQCVESFQSVPGITVPLKGRIYTIREILTEGSESGFRLFEIVNAPYRCWAPIRGVVTEEVVFVADHFRPLSDDRLAIFRQHLAPSPTDKVDA